MLFCKKQRIFAFNIRYKRCCFSTLANIVLVLVKRNIIFIPEITFPGDAVLSASPGDFFIVPIKLS